MSVPRDPTSSPSDEELSRTIVYDPTDPFWRDAEDDDDDDMDYMPAEGGSEEGGEDEDDEEAITFHGTIDKSHTV